MDPNLFHVDWEQLGEVLAALVVLSFVIERFLALIFEHRLFVEAFDKSGIKEPIAFALSLAVCWQFDFDVVAVLFTAETTTVFGKIVTAGVAAGGSKASMKLFHDVMGAKSRALAARKP